MCSSPDARVTDTPAAAQKDLHVGDRIIAVTQDRGPAVQVQNLMQMVRSIRGPKGTTVRLTIIPAGEDDSHARVVSFVRGELKSLWGDGVLLAIGTKAPDIEISSPLNPAALVTVVRPEPVTAGPPLRLQENTEELLG